VSAGSDDANESTPLVRKASAFEASPPTGEKASNAAVPVNRVSRPSRFARRRRLRERSSPSASTNRSGTYPANGIATTAIMRSAVVPAATEPTADPSTPPTFPPT